MTMKAMTKLGRLSAVLAGMQPDRPPVSFWHHFATDQRAGSAAVDAHLKHLNDHDLDFLKVMYDLGYPSDGPIHSVGQLESMQPRKGNDAQFAQHLDALRALAGELEGRARMTTTVFNSWATLRRLVREGPYVPGPGGAALEEDRPGRVIERLIAQDRGAVAHALRVIAETLADFARVCVEAGADGIYFSVRDEWVDTAANGPGTYDELVRPTDLRIIQGAAEGTFNMLHVCGHTLDFERFTRYPVHVFHWADRTAGPSIAEVAPTLRPVPCGGVDNLTTLPEGTPDACAAEVRDAIAQAAGRPLIIAPGCTYDPDRVPIANLKAVRRAVEEM